MVRVRAYLNLLNQSDTEFSCAVYEADEKYKKCAVVECPPKLPPKAEAMWCTLLGKSHMGVGQGVCATFSLQCAEGEIRVTVKVERVVVRLA